MSAGLKHHVRCLNGERTMNTFGGRAAHEFVVIGAEQLLHIGSEWALPGDAEDLALRRNEFANHGSRFSLHLMHGIAGALRNLSLRSHVRLIGLNGSRVPAQNGKTGSGEHC